MSNVPADSSTIVKTFIGKYAIESKQPSYVTELEEREVSVGPALSPPKGGADTAIKAGELAWKILTANQVSGDATTSTFAVHPAHGEPLDYHSVENWYTPHYSEFYDALYLTCTKVQLRVQVSNRGRPPSGVPGGYYIPSVNVLVDMIEPDVGTALDVSVDFAIPYRSEYCFRRDDEGVYHLFEPAKDLIVPIFLMTLHFHFRPFWRMGRTQVLTSTMAIRGEWPQMVYHNKDFDRWVK